MTETTQESLTSCELLYAARSLLDLTREELHQVQNPNFGPFELLRHHKGKIVIASKHYVIKTHEDKHPARFLISNEQKVVQELKTPYVPKLIATGDVQERTILIYQRIAALDINQAYISQAESLLIASRLGLALIDLHTQGICHNDIRPHNILWNALTQQISLIDFEYATPTHILGTEGAYRYFSSMMSTAEDRLYIKSQLQDLGGRWRSEIGIADIRNDISAAEKIIYDLSNRNIYWMRRLWQSGKASLRKIVKRK